MSIGHTHEGECAPFSNVLSNGISRNYNKTSNSTRGYIIGGEGKVCTSSGKAPFRSHGNALPTSSIDSCYSHERIPVAPFTTMGRYGGQARVD